MRGIAKLLFGDGEDGLLGRLGGSDGDGFGLAERARRSGEWCGSTPGGRPDAGPVWPSGTRHQEISREFHGK
jgi:hypothetical protein